MARSLLDAGSTYRLLFYWRIIWYRVSVFEHPSINYRRGDRELAKEYSLFIKAVLSLTCGCLVCSDMNLAENLGNSVALLASGILPLYIKQAWMVCSPSCL